MAEQISIKAEKREALGTRVSRRFRKSGKIPAVLAARARRRCICCSTAASSCAR